MSVHVNTLKVGDEVALAEFSLGSFCSSLRSMGAFTVIKANKKIVELRSDSYRTTRRFSVAKNYEIGEDGVYKRNVIIETVESQRKREEAESLAKDLRAAWQFMEQEARNRNMEGVMAAVERINTLNDTKVKALLETL